VIRPLFLMSLLALSSAADANYASAVPVSKRAVAAHTRSRVCARADAIRDNKKCRVQAWAKWQARGKVGRRCVVPTWGIPYCW
jgi:hypothetical protein